jgi:hypothetical protein
MACALHIVKCLPTPACISLTKVYVFWLLCPTLVGGRTYVPECRRSFRTSANTHPCVWLISMRFLLPSVCSLNYSPIQFTVVQLFFPVIRRGTGTETIVAFSMTLSSHLGDRIDSAVMFAASYDGSTLAASILGFAYMHPSYLEVESSNFCMPLPLSSCRSIYPAQPSALSMPKFRCSFPL